MHTARQLNVEAFAIRLDGAAATREDALPDWNELDRLGVVVTEPHGRLAPAT